MLPTICPARSCTRWMVVCGIEPFSVALNMPAAIPASSGNNWLGSGRRDWRLSCSVVVGVDIARPSLLDLSGVSVVRRHSAPECQAARQPHFGARPSGREPAALRRPGSRPVSAWRTGHSPEKQKAPALGGGVKGLPADNDRLRDSAPTSQLYRRTWVPAGSSRREPELGRAAVQLGRGGTKRARGEPEMYQDAAVRL